MKHHSPTRRRRLTTWLAALAVAFIALPQLGTSAEAGNTSYAKAAQTAAPAKAYQGIIGTGSTWSQVIVQQWISDVSANGIQVTYTGNGSSAGRKDFANGTNTFAISEIPYQVKDDFGNVDQSNRAYAYLPIVAGGTAFTYQLKIGGKMVNNLRLSGETIAKIFTNQITNWNDPQISKDNNGRKFPNLPITPVVRADGSGTTAQFTRYLDTEYPGIWRPFFGKSGLSSYFPKKGRSLPASGSDQVMNTISSSAGNGTIGYVEYSYPMNKGYPVVKVLNKAGYFVEPTQYNVAVALTKARINQDKGSINYLTQILDGVYRDTDPRTYPLSSYSYMIIPTGKDATAKVNTGQRQALADFAGYGLCGGQVSAGGYGYSPLPLNLVQAGMEQIAKLKEADPAVELTNANVKNCNNPTFDGANPSSNKLAKVAPMPAACDKNGAGPCGDATGTGKPTTDQAGSVGQKASGAAGGSAAAGGAAGTAAGGAAGTAVGAAGSKAAAGSKGGAAGTAAGAGGVGAAPGAGGAAGAAVDPDTGQVIGGDGTAVAGGVMGSPAEIAASRSSDNGFFGGLAALELLGLILLPALITLISRRRQAARANH